jgi:hypothetical protein
MKQYWKNLWRTLSKPIGILTVVWGTFYYILAGYIVLIRGDEFDTALLLGLALSVSLVVTLSLTNAIEER